VLPSVFRVEVSVQSVNLDPEDGGSMYLRNIGNTGHFHAEQRFKSVFNRELP
jgi:hypothetical protein